MKRENLLTCLSVFLLVAIFIFWGLARKNNNTKVVYDFNDSSSGYSESDSSKNKNNKNSSSKNDKNSTGKKENTSVEKENGKNSTSISFEEDMFSSENSTTSSINSSNPSSDQNSSNQDSSDENNSSSESTDNSNAEYKALLNRISNLQNYGINVHLNWYTDIYNSSYGVINDINLAQQMVGYVENIVNTLPNRYFYNLNSKGYTTKFILINNANSESVEYSMSTGEIVYYINNNYNLSITNFLYTVYDLNSNILGSNKINSIYNEFNRLNPKDFKYGSFNNEYIQRKYFLNIQSQKSVQDDCKNIFVKYYSNQLNINDYSGTVLFDKINYVVNFFDREVFY